MQSNSIEALYLKANLKHESSFQGIYNEIILDEMHTTYRSIHNDTVVNTTISQAVIKSKIIDLHFGMRTKRRYKHYTRRTKVEESVDMECTKCMKYSGVDRVEIFCQLTEFH